MTRHWLVSIDGSAPVHLTLGQYVNACERARDDKSRAPLLVDIADGSRVAAVSVCMSRVDSRRS